MNASVDTPHAGPAGESRPLPQAHHDGLLLARSLHRAEAAVRGRKPKGPSFNSAI
jgi:hypothetical protein